METVKEQEALVRHYETAGTNPALLAQKKAELMKRKQDLLNLAEGPQETGQGKDYLFGTGNANRAPPPVQQETERDRRLRLRAEERARRLAGESHSAYSQAETAKDAGPAMRREEPTYEAPSAESSYFPPSRQPEDYAHPEQRAYLAVSQQPYPQANVYRPEPSSRQADINDLNAGYRGSETNAFDLQAYPPNREQSQARPSDNDSNAIERRQEEYTGLTFGSGSDQRKLDQKRRLQEEYNEHLKSQQPKSRQSDVSTGGALHTVVQDDKAEKQRRYRNDLDMQMQQRPFDQSTNDSSRSSAVSRESGVYANDDRERRRLELEKKQQYAEALKAQMQAKQTPKQPDPVEHFESITRPPKPKNENRDQYRLQLQMQIEEKKRRAEEERQQRLDAELREEQRLKREVGNPDNKPIAKTVTKDPNRPSDDHPNADRYKQLMSKRQLSGPDALPGSTSFQANDNAAYDRGGITDMGPSSGLMSQLPPRPPLEYPSSHDFPREPVSQAANFSPINLAYNQPPQGQPYPDYALTRELQEMQRASDKSKEQILELKEMMLRERERALFEMAQVLQMRAPGYPPQIAYPQYPPQGGSMYPPSSGYPGYPGYPPQPPHSYAPHPNYPHQPYPPTSLQTQLVYSQSDPYMQSQTPIQPAYFNSDPVTPIYNEDNAMSFSHKLDTHDDSGRLSEFGSLPPSKFAPKAELPLDIRQPVKRSVSATFAPSPDAFQYRVEANSELLRSREIKSTYHINALKAVEPETAYQLNPMALETNDDLLEQSLACESKWVNEADMRWGTTKLLDSVADLNTLKASHATQRSGWGQPTDSFRSPQPAEKKSIDGTPRFNMHQLRSTLEFEESLPSDIMHIPVPPGQEVTALRQSEAISEESLEEEIEEDYGTDSDFEPDDTEAHSVRVGLTSDENAAAQMDFADEIAKNFEEAEDSDEAMKEPERTTKTEPAYPAPKVRPASMISRIKPKIIDVFKPKLRDTSIKQPPLKAEQPVAVIQPVAQSEGVAYRELQDARAKHKAAKQTALNTINSLLDSPRESTEAFPTTSSKFSRDVPTEQRDR